MIKNILIALTLCLSFVSSNLAQSKDEATLFASNARDKGSYSNKSSEYQSIVNTDPKILLPIEVLGAEGTVVEREFSLGTAELSVVSLLWLQVNNLGYQNKASIKINDLDWVDLNHNTTNIQSPEKERGGMAHGGHNTIRFSLPVVGLVNGLNKISFRFNKSDAISNGFRVVRMNLLDISNNKILDEEYFEEEDPLSWVGPYTDAASIAEGKDYWYNADLASNYLAPGAKGFWYGYKLNGQGPIKAKCASCHAQDGRDLEIFSYSNESIIERSKFHMLSEEQGKKIASYIRSLSDTKDNVGRYGRPWNPPYQPGPELANKPIEEWAAGAGLDAVLEADKDMLPYMFPGGVSEEAVNERFDSEKMVDRTLLPLAIQLPDWKHWLPMVHPMDAYTKDNYWNDPISHGGKTTIFPKEGYKDFRAYLEAMPPASRDPEELMEENRKFWYHHRFFLAQGRADGSLAGHWREEESRATSKLADGVPREFAATSLARLMGVKYFEIMNEFDLQDKAHWFAKPEDQPASRQWFGKMYQVFEIPAHFQACVPDDGMNIVGNCTSFFGQPKETGEYESTNWYHLQLVINGGNGMVSHNSPVDYNYHPTFILRASSSSGIYEPLRYYHSMNAMYQFRSWSGATNPNEGKGFRIRVQGPWHIIGRTDSNQLHDFAESVWPTFLDRIQPGMSKWVLNAQLRQFLTEVRKPENNLANWNRLPNGGSNELDAINKTTSQLKDMSNYTGLDFWADKFYYLLPEFAKLGVNCQVLEEMIDWCEEAWPNIDWAKFRSGGELQLSLLSEDSEVCSINSDTITAEASNEGDDPLYEWWVDNEKVINNSKELDVSDIRPGALIKCRVTSSKNCISNGWIESELSLPGDGFVIQTRKNGADWEELNNSVACTDDTMEFKIDPDLQEPLFWLDAMDVKNDDSKPANGSNVSKWFNKSTSGYMMDDQSNNNLRPMYNQKGMNGLPALMFGTDGADGLELFTTANDDYLNNNWTLVVAGSYNRRGAWNSLLGNENGDSGFGFHINGDHGRTRTKINGNQVHGRYYKDKLSFVLMITKDRDKVKIYINGKLEEEIEASSSNLTNAKSFYLGQLGQGNPNTNWYHKGPISEVLFYDHNISNTQKNYIEGYLMQKWNFAQELPPDHVYKENSPLNINLQTPNGETLIFDKNNSMNSIELDNNSKFGNFSFTRPNCSEPSSIIAISNGEILENDLVKYSINNNKFKIGNNISAFEDDEIELEPNFEFNGAYQWEDPEGNLLERNTNPDKFIASMSNDHDIWKLSILQDLSSCISSDQELLVTLNVIEVPYGEKDDDNDGVKNSLDQCPGSMSGVMVNAQGCLSLPANNFKIETVGETCIDKNNGIITINTLQALNYTATLGNGESYVFTNDLILENLDPGDYSICLKVAEETSYEQCFNLVVEASEAVLGKLTRTEKNNIVTENIRITSGTPPYSISINGKKMLTTFAPDFSVDVNHGDKISVSSKFSCEGIFTTNINLLDYFIAYPNPTTSFTEIVIPNMDLEKVFATVYNSLHQKISEKQYELHQNKIKVSLNNNSPGIYYIRLDLETPVHLKLVKQ